MPAPATLTLVDGNPIVGRAFKVLLEGAGYKVLSLAYPFDGHLDELLEESHLLLLPPTLSLQAREELVSDLKDVPALAALPVVALVAPGDEATQDVDGLVAYVPWPSRIEVLVVRIEAGLGSA